MQNRMNMYRNIEISNEVSTEDPYKLAVLLVDGAINFVSQAQVLMNENNVGGKCHKIKRALDIVTHVKAALNVETGGEVIANMEALLEFVRDELIDANVASDHEKLSSAAKVLREVKQCFELCLQQRM